MTLILFGLGFLFFSHEQGLHESNRFDPRFETQSKQVQSDTKLKTVNAQVETKLPEVEKYELAEKMRGLRAPSALMNAEKTELSARPLAFAPRWKIWKNVKAIKSEIKPDGNVLIGTFNRYYIVRDADSEKTDLTQFNSEQPTVVYDERLRKPGLVTGMIKIETMDRVQLESDLNRLHAHIFDAFENINTYFISDFDSRFNLQLLFTTLKARPYVQNIELDITGITYEKN